ncbi:MAG: hypothetical protein K9J21_07255 [Bacteroidales bacterium]|nr:hypothetical protein [Bacteroidales bacterium]
MSQQNNKSAFPRAIGERMSEGGGRTYNNSQPGMSKRFYAACKAMEGLLSSERVNSSIEIKNLADKAYKIADEMINQENQ